MNIVELESKCFLHGRYMLISEGASIPSFLCGIGKKTMKDL